MSRRFGRNQKRALRGQVEQFMAQRDEAYKATKRHAAHAAELSRQIDHVRGCLGPQTFMLTPSEVAFRAGEVGYRNIRVHNYNLAAVQDVPVIMARHNIDPDNPLSAIHLIVNYGNRQIGYAVSRETFRVMPPEVVARQIAHEMANLLVDEMSKVTL